MILNLLINNDPSLCDRHGRCQRIPEEILRKLGAGVGDLISFVKDGDSIRLVVKKQNSIQKDQPKAATGLTKPLRIPTMQFATD